MSDNFNQFPNQNPNQQQVQYAVDAAMKEEKKKKRKKKLIILAVIAVVLIAIIAAAGSGSSDSKSNSNSGEGSSASAVEAASEEKKDGEIGDYKCVVKSAELCKNWEGKDAVKITYAFTNNSDDAQSFDIALSDNVYQDGIGLETTFISATDDDDDWGVDVKIKPGATKDVRKVYLLRDKNTELEVEIGELISFDDTKVTTKVKIKQ